MPRTGPSPTDPGVVAGPTRMIAVWCPDWPVTAACLSTPADTTPADTAPAGTAPTNTWPPDSDAPVAVVVANRIVACSHTARTAGVVRGLRRREAQGRCPELIVLPRNEAAEARLFEPIIAALESIAPGVEITRPGLAAIGMRGPRRYFGSETAVLHALSRAVTEHRAVPEHRAATSPSARSSAASATDLLIGVADGAFAAEQAARRGVIVEAGHSPEFLADLPIETLDPSGDSPLIDLLRRLGLLTLGAFAALPPRDVLARFGPSGVWAHRQAGGRDDRPVAGRRPPVEFTVTLDLEPPVDRIDTIAFSARSTAEQFVGDLGGHGLACTCVELQAFSENGEETVRRWRHAGVMSTSDVLDRVRWQLEGWLTGSAGARRPTGGVARLRLVPIETVPTGTHQRALWGGSGDEDERTHRALARVQTLLGHGSVFTPVVEGGRDPQQRTRLVPWGDEPEPLRSPDQPWPGQIPPPAPAVLMDPPQPATLLDETGHPVYVSARGAMAMPPTRFAVAGERPVAVTAWAGPWPVDERWWSSEGARRVVRCQIVDVRGRAFLVTGTMPSAGTPATAPENGAAGPKDGPQWQVEAVYD